MDLMAADIKNDIMKAVLSYPKVKKDIKYNQNRLQRKLNLTDTEVTGILITAKIVEGEISTDQVNTKVNMKYADITPTFNYNWKTKVGMVYLGLDWRW